MLLAHVSIVLSAAVRPRVVNVPELGERFLAGALGWVALALQFAGAHRQVELGLLVHIGRPCAGETKAQLAAVASIRHRQAQAEEERVAQPGSTTRLG